VTEKGRIRTRAVVLAGGAWSSIFCHRHGIALPLAMVKATAFATTAAPDIWGGALGTPGYCIRRRVDGGYTVALRGQGTVDLTPQDLRFARAFWPTWKQRRAGLKMRLGKAFLDGLRWQRAWSFDATSPFEEVRVLDPAPDPELVARGMAQLRAAFPALGGIEVAQAWGGSIDSTPDAVPVISAVPQMEGLFLAAGFSGHGFGIGPGAGRLAADLVCGDTPVVDPTPYRYARFTAGEKLAPAGAL
jgi:glycine/D-amino acid oxidase-like deaminating enzyme